MFDCHMHSNFSGDSEMDPLEACNTAIKLGLDGLIFTDHLDYDYPDYSDDFLIDFDKYSPFMDNLKDKYKGKLKVLKGIEVGIQPHVLEKSEKVVEKYDFDYVIGSIHIIDGLDPSNPKHNLYSDKPQHQVFERYLKEILFMVGNFDNFDVLGHIDYIRRYDCNYVKMLSFNDHSDIIDSILKELISKGKGMEINSAGYRCNLNPPLVDINIIKRYKELGGEVICTGSDAHSTVNIADYFGDVKELVINSGFKYIAHFEGRRPVFEKI